MKDCGFCQGQPVGNAASWLDGKPKPPAPCPRCGDITYPDGRVVTEQERLAARRAATSVTEQRPERGINGA